MLHEDWNVRARHDREANEVANVLASLGHSMQAITYYDELSTFFFLTR
jgi:hypothetical protein